MGRTVDKPLTAITVRTTARPMHGDGNGLYLATTNGGRRWVFVYKWDGKRRTMGLGSASRVSLADARKKAADARAQLGENRDPIAVRDHERAKALLPPPEILTFGKFADAYIKSVESGWRNEKHREQWANSLRDHAKCIRDKPVATVDTDDMLAVLQPIWTKIPETASRVRGRIEKILSAAKARGARPRDAANPALWRGHLDVLLPKRQRLTRGHHAAMPYANVPAFMRQLSDRPAMAARAVEFLILTAARSGEIRGATWDEIQGDVWTIPAERMKAGATHTVTLSAAAIAALDTVGVGPPDAHIFPSQAKGRPLSDMALTMLLRRMGEDSFTVHGFRSAFKDWAIDCTEYPDEISEEALAHVVGSKVRRAYRRGEALDRRRALMEAWAAHLADVPAAALAEAAAA